MVRNLNYNNLDDVIENVKEDFKREGVSESVLQELKKIWESKLKKMGINFEQEMFFEGTAQEVVQPLIKDVNRLVSDEQKRKKKKIEQVDGKEDENDDEEEILGSEDDDENEDKVPETSDIVLAQYEKVTRTKNKWKCKLKCGFMSLNGVDYLFHEGTGEFDW